MKAIGEYVTGPNPEHANGVYIGDAWELTARVPDGSIDLIFTDPVYTDFGAYINVAREARRILKPTGNLLVFYGIGYTVPTYESLATGGMPVKWPFIIHQPGQTQRVHPRIFNHYYAMLWCGHKGPVETIVDVSRSEVAAVGGDSKWRWRKNPIVMARYIVSFTRPGDVVLDMFAGTGSTAVAATQVGREFLCFESNSGRAEFARRRVRETRIPLVAPDANTWAYPETLLDLASSATVAETGA